MSTFYIVPPRKTSLGLSDQAFVSAIGNGAVNLAGQIAFTSLNNSITVVVNDNNNTLDLSLNTANFVQKTLNSVITANMKFAPTVGNVGLILHSDGTNPSSTEVGGLYYNTADQTLKIYNGAAWSSIAQIGALTLSQANQLYLQLSGGSLTGKLLLSNSPLRLTNLSTAPSLQTSQEGDLFYNSVTKKLVLNNGTAWVDIASGSLTFTNINSPILFNGLSTTSISFGTINISLDQSYNYNWTGSNSFSQPITFANGQTFDINKLTIASPSPANGQIIYRNNNVWTVLPPGSLNQVLKINSSGIPVWSAESSKFLETPTDGSLTDGYFTNWTTNTTITDAIDEINELLNQISPSKPNLLTSTSLVTVTSPTVNQVKLSAGLSNSWYYSKTTPSGATTAKSPGDLINGYFVSGNIVLQSPSGSYYAGKAGAAEGTTSHKVYFGGATVTSIVAVSRTLTSGTGASTSNNSILNVNSIQNFNNIWSRAESSITYTQTLEGWIGHSLIHTLSGESDITSFYYDTNQSAPTFSVAPSITSESPNIIYISSIKHYGLGSIFYISFTAAGGSSGIFSKCYHPTNVAKISGTGINDITLNPVNPPTYTDSFVVSNTAATLSKSNDISTSYTITVSLFKANGLTASSNLNLNKYINTYTSDPSDNTNEYFTLESRRLLSDSNSTFSSTLSMAEGYLQIKNGELVWPSSDYSDSNLTYTGGPITFNSSPKRYERFFTNAECSSITLTIYGLSSSTSISSYLSGNVNIIAQLFDINDSSKKYFDLGQNFISNVPLATPFTDVNNSTHNLYAAKISSSFATVNGVTVTTLTFTFGVQNTQSISASPNNGKYRLIVIYRNSTTEKITQITSTAGAI